MALAGRVRLRARFAHHDGHGGHAQVKRTTYTWVRCTCRRYDGPQPLERDYVAAEIRP